MNTHTTALNSTQTNSQTAFTLSPKDVFFLQGVVNEIYRMTPFIEFKALFSILAKESKKN